jgi:uncharacterized membrane protein YozB (DUF420 family)
MELPILTKVLNSVAVLLVALGIAKRRRPRVHVPVMLAAGLVDLVNLLLVEYHARASRGRGAVEQGIGIFASGGDLLPHVHVAVSTLCILSYVVALVTGFRLLRGRPVRSWHKGNAVAFVVLRLSSYVTSFWM